MNNYLQFVYNLKIYIRYSNLIDLPTVSSTKKCKPMFINKLHLTKNLLSNSLPRTNQNTPCKKTKEKKKFEIFNQGKQFLSPEKLPSSQQTKTNKRIDRKLHSEVFLFGG